MYGTRDGFVYCNKTPGPCPADVAGQHEREPQQLDVEQMRRARTERFEGAQPPLERQQQPQRQTRSANPPLSRPNYGQMSNRELNRYAYRRLGPGYREDMESRGNRRRALIRLLESYD